MNTQDRRVCTSCGNELSGEMKFCPVCALRKALAGEVESGESSFQEAITPAPEQAGQRFEHYEMFMGQDGKPLELGRGAMGVTYKAFDVDLHCLVTLKVISERYLGDESARLRFLREARAAARLRHSNVASVLHLGRTGNSYFYAMEFVDGETLENLINRSGRLEAKLALEIVTQVAAGEDPHHRRHLDTHPLVREYFGKQLRKQRTVAWKECNRRLYRHYRAIAPQSPDSFREMEPLFLAVICGCNAGLFHETLHEVYIPRIQRGEASFAANVLGARGPLPL